MSEPEKPVDNTKVEIEDLKNSLAEKIKELNDQVVKNATMEAQFGALKQELNWLREVYDNLCFSVFDKLDDIAHTVKKSNFENLMKQRREQERIEAEAVKVKANEPIPKGYVDIKQ